MAIAMAAGVISCLVSSWMISHFGIKPVNGGRPARDKSTSIRVAFSTGVFVHEVMIMDRLRALILLRARNTADVMIVYR